MNFPNISCEFVLHCPLYPARRLHTHIVPCVRWLWWWWGEARNHPQMQAHRKFPCSDWATGVLTGLEPAGLLGPLTIASPRICPAPGNRPWSEYPAGATSSLTMCGSSVGPVRPLGNHIGLRQRRKTISTPERRTFESQPDPARRSRLSNWPRSLASGGFPSRCKCPCFPSERCSLAFCSCTRASNGTD